MVEAAVAKGLKKALQRPGPALIDVVTDPNAVSLPTHVSADQLMGFGVAMAKLALSDRIDEVVDRSKLTWGTSELCFQGNPRGVPHSARCPAGAATKKLRLGNGFHGVSRM